MSVATVVEGRSPQLTSSSASASGRRALRRGFVAALGAGAVFVLLQGLLAAYNLHVFRAAVAKRLDQLPVTYCLGHCLREAVPEALFAYAGFALAGVVVAAAGHRLLCALPASLYVLFGLPQSPHVPLPIGQQWQLTCYERCPGPWFSSPWVGAATDLVLVLVPAVLVAWTLRPQRWPGSIDETVVASVGLALGLVLLTYRTAGVIDRPPDIRVACAVAALAVAAGARRPWWPWAHLIAATAFSGYFVWVWSTIVAPNSGVSISIVRELFYDLAALTPILVIAVVGSSWNLVAAALRKGIHQPVALVVAVNALNLADALLTRFAVASGGALELNPFVRALGLPVKLVAVAALTVLLYKRRAPALVWPVAVLLWVLCYHISGIVVNH